MMSSLTRASRAVAERQLMKMIDSICRSGDCASLLPQNPERWVRIESGVEPAQPPPRAQHMIFVRRRQLDREITEGTSLTRQEPPALLFLLKENGGGTAPVRDLAGGQTHLARATAATSAAEHDARPSSEDSGQYGLLGATCDGAANRPQCDRVQARLTSSQVSHHTRRPTCRRSRTSRSVPVNSRRRLARSGPGSTGWFGSPDPSDTPCTLRTSRGGCRRDRRNKSSFRA